jgi:hypothetical protein
MCAKWSHKREALSWLIWFAVPLTGLACSIVFPFASAHPMLFRVLLIVVPAVFIIWAVVAVVRDKKDE